MNIPLGQQKTDAIADVIHRPFSNLLAMDTLARGKMFDEVNKQALALGGIMQEKWSQIGEIASCRAFMRSKWLTPES